MNSPIVVKSHAVRLGLDASHLSRLSHDGRQPAEPVAGVSELAAQRNFLRVAAGTLAATWFMLGVDGGMTMYLIPSRAIAGRVSILLRTYRRYVVGSARGLLGDMETRSGEVRASA
jgi:hypothetical protein